MANESTTVNDLVIQHAAQSKEPAEVVIPKEEEKKEETATVNPEEGKAAADNPLDGLLKEYGLGSIEDLKERLKTKEPEKVETPEEIQKRQDIYNIEMRKYAVENGLMKDEDFSTLETLKSKEDRALVYENWLKDWKEENPDVEAEDIEEQAQRDFESEYHLNSTNEKTKNRGLAKLTKEAKEMRSPLENAFKNVKTEFDEDRTVKNDYPDYSKKVAGFIQENIPAKVKLFETKDGDDTVPVEIELSDEQRRDIYQKVAKKVMNSSTYKIYKGGDEKQLKEIAKREAESLIWEEQREAGLNKIAETFLKRGDEKGYKRGSIGAKNSFPLIGDGKQGDGKDNFTATQKVLNQPAFTAKT